MDNNPNNDSIKSHAKWGIYSLVAGFINFILTLIFLYYFILGKWWSHNLIFFMTAFISIYAISGLVFGVKGRKSSKDGLAKTGIILCSLILLIWIYFFFGWLSTDPW
jgi:hypothetical protein